MKRWMPKFVPNANSPSRRLPSSVVQHLRQELLVLGRGPLHRQPVLEPHLDALHLAALVDRGEAERDVAVDLGLLRPGEHFAVGHVPVALAVDERAPLDADGQVGALADQVDLLLAFQVVDQHLLLATDLLPCGDRVGLVAQARAVDEILEIGQRHLRVLGVCVGGEHADVPAQLARRAAIHEGLHERAHGSAAQRLLRRVDARQFLGVDRACDGDPDVKCLHRELERIGNPLQLLVRTAFSNRMGAIPGTSTTGNTLAPQRMNAFESSRISGDAAVVAWI